MVVQYIKFSHQLLQRVIIFFFVMGSLVRYLFINLAKQRMKFDIEMLKPLKHLYFIFFISSFEVLSSQIVQYGIRLIDRSLRSKEYERLIFFGYFLLIECLVEKEESGLYLFQVGIIVLGEIKSGGHSIYMFLLYQSNHNKSFLFTLLLALISNHSIFELVIHTTIIIFTTSYMLTHLFKRIPSLTQKYTFATAVTRDRVDYYRILEVDQGATEQNIRSAYAELTRGLIPERDFERFRQLNEAFVILTDNKTRDAYDSLLSVRKTNYLSPEQPKVPSTKSYLAERKSKKLQQTRKRLNIDEFGRYQGGLPNKTGFNRRGALDKPDTMHRSGDIEQALDTKPEYNFITAEKAESFKNFHQDERTARQMKWPWFTFQVDYEYFKLTNFRRVYWPRFQLIIFLFYILPTFYYIVERFEKEELTKSLKLKAAKAEEVHHEHSSA